MTKKKRRRPAPSWAPFVTFTVGGTDVMVLARMPTEPERWRIVARELGRICMHYGGKSKGGLSGLDGCYLPRGFAGMIRLDPTWLPEFELWNWSRGAFRLIRNRTKE